jgi:formate hydrogenlyase subunit 6/NADH:ubiquinone oxidoreductase subunit I
MLLTRKELFKKIFNIAGPAAVIGFVYSAVHALLDKTYPNYPVVPGKRSNDSVRLIRPPGALGERKFLAACIRCYRCQDACDIGAIQFYSEADGKYYHSPYIDPALKSCNLCMKCTLACPTGALVHMRAEEKDKVAMASVELFEDLCLSYKAKAIRNEQALLMEMGRPPTESAARVERRGPCGECHMFCPLREEAIRLEPGSFLAPIIVKENCVGCGMCEEICRVIKQGEPAIRVVPTRQRI